MLKLFSHALEERNMELVDKMPSILFTDEEVKWHKFIRQYNVQYGELPTVERLEREFDDFTYTPVATPRGLLESVMTTRKERLLNEFVTSTYSASSEEVKVGANKLSMQMNAHPTSVMSIRNVDSRLFIKPDEGYFICSPGFTHVLNGIYKGELVTLIGESGVGKSLLVMNTAINWYLSGLRVMVIAADMKPSTTMMRAQAMLLKTNSEAMHEVSALTQQSLSLLMDKMPGELIIPDVAPRNVAQITGLIAEYEIDALVVDGTYFLQATFGKRSMSRGWENISMVSEELKNLSHTQSLPILSVSQTNDDGKVAYSRAIEQDSDMVLLARHQGELLAATDAKLLRLTTMKNRRGNLWDASVQINFNSMSVVDRTQKVITGVPI